MSRIVAHLILLLAFWPAVAFGEACLVLVDETDPKRPDIDGPGSFGPLHETMSLGCFAYERFLPSTSRAILRDYLGREFEIGVGDYVGEYSGRASDISAERIVAVQVVRGSSGEYEEVPRYLFLGPRR